MISFKEFAKNHLNVWRLVESGFVVIDFEGSQRDKWAREKKKEKKRKGKNMRKRN